MDLTRAWLGTITPPRWTSSRPTSIAVGISCSAAIPRGAELSARRALEIDSQSPEAHNLLGYVCALKAEYEDAIENYRQAIALDDTYLEAMLNAAEVYIHPLGEFDEALSMCDQALDLAETDDEVVDCLLAQVRRAARQG